MARANAFAGPQRQKLAYAACVIALAVFTVLVFKVFGLFVEDGPGKAVAPTAQPVFIETKSKLPAQGRAVSENEITPPPKVQLSGIVGGADGQQLAIISVNKAPELLVRVGDQIFAASTVTEINQDSLTYRHGSDLIRVFIQGNAAPTQTSVGSANPTSNKQPVARQEDLLPGFMKSTGTAGQQSSAESKNGNVEFRQAFETKMNSLQTRP